MRNRIENFLAGISRHLYRIPGGFFVVVLLKRIFPATNTSEFWKTFRFRGMVFRVDVSKGMGNAIFWRGAHDWAPLFVLERVLKKGETFIDIGANQGEYTLWGLRKVGPEGKVLAYEPSERIYRQLEENIRLNPRYKNAIVPRKLGLSDRPGTLNLYTKSGTNEGVNSMFPSAEHDVFLNEIDLSTLDEEVEKLGLKRVDCLKIDVEGAELAVLKGGLKTIATFRPKILVEINKESCNAAGYEATELVHFLENQHYNLFTIGLRGKLIPLKKDRIPEFSNTLAFPL
ncbi:FkbM family methyltransferase [Cyclobacterium xiamenense]|jgi:FkbM family methyltransferase|uniref:FkbM family methyltransferase n=1 Tax=Cyclobacterium xiamenense TaxID=1297121 RepID=UPI0035CF8908